MLECAACASKNLHVAARMYVSGRCSAVCLPQPCSCVVCPAVACPALAVRTYDAAPCTCAAARVLSRVVTMRVGLCDKDASLREMDGCCACGPCDVRAYVIPVRSLSIGFQTHVLFDCHHLIMIAISAAHLFCFSNILQLLAGCGGERMWGRSAAERGPTFSQKKPPRSRRDDNSKARRFAPAIHLKPLLQRTGCSLWL